MSAETLPKPSRQTVRFLFRYARRHALWALIAAVAVTLFALTSGATIYLIDPVFDEVLLAGEEARSTFDFGVGKAADEADDVGESDAGGLAAFAKRFNLRELFDRSYEGLKRRLGVTAGSVVYFVPILVIVIFIVRSASDFASGYSFQRIGLGVTTDIRNDIFRRVVQQSTRFHSEHPTGELASRVIGDVSTMQVAVSTRVLDLFQQSATLVVLVVLLLSTHFKLALVCLVATPIVVYPIVRFGRDMRRTSRRSQERMADLSQLLVEAVRGHRVVRAFGMEEFETRRFSAATRRHLRVRLRAEMYANLSGPVISIIAAIGSAAFLIYAGRMVRSGELTGTLVIQFLANLMLMYDPIRRLNRVHLQIQEALAAVHRVIDLLRIPIDVEERPGARELTTFESKIAFEGVSFSYGSESVLHDVDLEIGRGEIVAVVGPSGAGKTTLANLLLRFFDPTAGRVTVDGHDLRDLTLGSISSLMSIVTQETVLFNDTVFNNIAYGHAETPQDRVEEAARAAFAEEFIRRLPQGYETPLGEGGARLSGGERQRLAIARALLKGAPILILDEATSQLDTESEALVRQALYNLMRDRTTLVIAHRLSTITSATRIVVMEDGRITEVGNHQELLERDGSYRRLYDLQFET